MATEANKTSVEVKVIGPKAPQKTEKLRQLFMFQHEEYDLNNLTEAQKEYLKGFPDEVPFLK